MMTLKQLLKDALEAGEDVGNVLLALGYLIVVLGSLPLTIPIGFCRALWRKICPRP